MAMPDASHSCDHPDNAEGRLSGGLSILYTRSWGADVNLPESFCFKPVALILEPRAVCFEDPLSEFLLQV